MSYGIHAMIAEEVTKQADGSLTVRVSEMNVANSDSGQPNAGKWQYAYPDEFQNTREFTLSADGTWSRDGSEVSITVFNPEFGNPRI